MKKNEKKFFIGIDLGGKNKKTTGLCILEKNRGSQPKKEYCSECQEVFGNKILKVISSYLKNTAVIAIDAPLTTGRGKGKMRLFEKFLSTKIFRKGNVTPIPPALMPSLVEFAQELVRKLGKRGFVLDLNLVETFPTLVKKVCQKKFFLFPFHCQNENQRSAFICAKVAFCHFQFKTRYLGYKDGFLFLPAFSFWKKKWRQKFYQAWKNRPRFKYRRLITNIFE